MKDMMQESIESRLVCPDHRLPLSRIEGPLSSGANGNGIFRCPNGCQYPIVEGIPRFVAADNYADAFGLQWNVYRQCQLDSHTGQPISRVRLERCLGKSLEELKGQRILECGSGAGRFTELLIGRCEHLVSTDLSTAVTANWQNCGHLGPYTLVQADINKSPLPRRYFDICICLGVLQHTPSPEATILNLAAHVRPGGLLVIDHYAKGKGVKAITDKLTLAVPIRQILIRVKPSVGLRASAAITAFCDPIRKRTCRYRPVDRIAARLFPSICHYPSHSQLADDVVYRLNELDTHDAFTDRFKHRRSLREIHDFLDSQHFEAIEVREAGNGIEARCRVPEPTPNPLLHAAHGQAASATRSSPVGSL